MIVDTNRNRGPEAAARIEAKDRADAHAVHALVTEHRGWVEVLGPELSDRISKVQLEIEAGIPDHAEYLRKVGELEGLRYIAKRIDKYVRQATEGGPEE